MATKTDLELDPEFVAMTAVHAALKGLEPEVQTRVLNYVASKLKLASPTAEQERRKRHEPEPADNADDADESQAEDNENATEETGGISPAAKRWLTRNGLKPNQISSVFSIGGDEIDLIAETVPGKSKAGRMRNVFLLKGVAAYLGTGAARFTHEQVKEACLHYDAFDYANFASHIKDLSSEVSGSKDAGYVLTARGLAAATKLVKEMAGSDKS
jgi:hypothetical protein